MISKSNSVLRDSATTEADTGSGVCTPLRWLLWTPLAIVPFGKSRNVTIGEVQIQINNGAMSCDSGVTSDRVFLLPDNHVDDKTPPQISHGSFKSAPPTSLDEIFGLPNQWPILSGHIQVSDATDNPYCLTGLCRLVLVLVCFGHNRFFLNAYPCVLVRFILPCARELIPHRSTPSSRLYRPHVLDCYFELVSKITHTPISCLDT
ncbi:hypothetical protein B0H19DRAFT_1267128 [Mycena capillaripes]|nr:hypothetical protein B0H19DRAFT_1267128 [Mycena capillaripes]